MNGLDVSGSKALEVASLRSPGTLLLYSSILEEKFCERTHEY